VVGLLLAAFGHAGAQTPEVLLRAPAPGAPPPAFADDGRRGERLAMVREQIASRGVVDRFVLTALERVPRHRFVPAGQAARAYADRPLPIGHGQTISQPFIVGYMTELLGLEAGDRVLEVGTGSAYQAAVLAEIVAEVVSIEILRPLAESASARLGALGYGNVTVVHGDGYFGWPDAAPYDAVVVTAAADHVPPPLVAQLRPGARMAIPVGASAWTQNLLLVEKHADGRLTTRNLLPVRFVPLTGSR
jgi:protein-L-isoaspartate(D-aspartate) O-methyltransferase